MTEKVGVLGKKTSRRTDVERIVETPLPTVYGKFRAYGYLDHERGDEQVALVHGDLEAE
ncbi:GTP cyclohydrolase II, partial [Streptomyces sp. SID6648]|nr:GTP cyclohydrolase II [Streptomyces sp. SID6648]